MRLLVFMRTFVLVIFLLGAQPAVVFAQPATQNGGGTVNPAQGYNIQNPLSVDSFCSLINLILKSLLAIGSPVAALFIVLAGFKFNTARGNPRAHAKAKENLVYVILGIGIFFAAWLLGQVIANTIKNISPQNASSAGSCK